MTPLRTLLLALATAFFAARSEAAFVNFEIVPGVTPTGGYLAGIAVGPGSQLTNQLAFSDGVNFSSTPGYVALVGLGLGHATSGSNGIGGVSPANTLSYSEPVLITFSVPGSPGTPAFADTVSIRADQFATSGTITLEAYNFANMLIASTTVADGSGVTLSLSVPNIYSLRLTNTSGTVAYDDLNFGPLSPVPQDTAVPAPATAVIFAFGFAGIARVIRRRLETIVK